MSFVFYLTAYVAVSGCSTVTFASRSEWPSHRCHACYVWQIPKATAYRGCYGVGILRHKSARVRRAWRTLSSSRLQEVVLVVYTSKLFRLLVGPAPTYAKTLADVGKFPTEAPTLISPALVNQVERLLQYLATMLTIPFKWFWEANAQCQIGSVLIAPSRSFEPIWCPANNFVSDNTWGYKSKQLWSIHLANRSKTSKLSIQDTNTILWNHRTWFMRAENSILQKRPGDLEQKENTQIAFQPASTNGFW